MKRFIFGMVSEMLTEMELKRDQERERNRSGPQPLRRKSRRVNSGSASPLYQLVAMAQHVQSHIQRRGGGLALCLPLGVQGVG